MLRCYTASMPTIRPRYTLTETPELAEALNAAATIWPELRHDRPALLRRLVESGHQAVIRTAEEHSAARREALHHAAGAVTGAYPAAAADLLKSEWPD